MLNYIWFALMAIALVVAIFTGSAPAVTKGAVDSAKTAVDISLGLIGIMTLWLGIMRVAEKAGLIALLGRMLRPISRVLFPEVPPDHPAIGSIIMNVAANLLGLSNAATPFGIKAMEELQTLNSGDKETASNAMVTFMTLNTAGIQFIPATMIGVLAAAGSKNPTAIIAPTFISTLCGAVVAVTMSKVLQRFSPSPSGRGWREAPGEGPEATKSPNEGPEGTNEALENSQTEVGE
ncbi:MAG TPA: nucleoside recognition domain-containing protein [Thermoanaerobaculia bacterium]|jgi:spore maturation protein A